MQAAMGDLKTMSLVLSSLLFLATADAELPTLDLVPSDEAERRLAACGLVDVEARYDDQIQDHVLHVEDSAPPDESLACAADVSSVTGYWIELPENSRDAYFAHYRRVSRQRSQEWARERLTQQGLLAAAPVYVPGETDDKEFADRLESLCGDAAKGALQSEFGPHAISPAWAQSRDGKLDETAEVMMCLMTYAAAAGYEMHFIGNGKAAEPD